MREIAAVTVGRSDFGIYHPVWKAIQAHSDLRLRILASGMHLSPEFGLTVGEIEAAGFEVFERIESQLSSDTPAGIAKSMGLGVIGFAQLFSRYRPDIVLLLGDRFDMMPAAIAALPYGIVLAHVHGGEVTEGAMDDAIRHSISKMSHLHFVAAEPYASRLRQMGEEEWRIIVSGSPAVDRSRIEDLMTPAEVSARFGIVMGAPCLLVTYHPVTLEAGDTERQIANLLAALDKMGLPCLFTYPNADTFGQAIIDRIRKYCATHPQSQVVINAGQRGYLSLMKTVSAMVGNSSSGLIEAASFELPVVNVGHRQKGRIQARNVINCGYEIDDLCQAIRQATEPSFRKGLQGLVNPYGSGHAATRIVETLAGIELGEKILIKRFVDRPASPIGSGQANAG